MSFSHLPTLSDRMQRLDDSPADSALAEAGLRSACRRLMRLEGSLDRMWDAGAIPSLAHSADATAAKRSSKFP